MKNSLSTLIAFALLTILGSCCQCNEPWVKYDGNPVLGGRELGTCFDVNVIEEGPAKYNMYFSWRPEKCIAFSKSDDGINWSAPEKVLLEDSTSGWEDIINRSCTIVHDGKYRMWYTGQKDGRSCIGYSESTDGLHFYRVQKEPVLEPETDYEIVSVMNPFVMWDEERQTYRMWYASGEASEPNVLCYAESPDGLKWERSPLNPIFTHGEGDVWDKDRIGGCDIHVLEDGTFLMFYIGFSDVFTARIGAAVSKDGITGWKRLESNPLVEPTPGTWDAEACYKPSALYDKENDRWLLWYNGRKGWDEYIGFVTRKGYRLK